MGTDEPLGWGSETELLRAFEPWRFSKYVPPEANPGRTHTESASLQRSANTMKWQKQRLRASLHQGEHDLTSEDSAKSRDSPAAVAHTLDDQSDGWRRSKFVPPADAPSAPRAARGLGAVLSRVTSLLSFVGTGPAPEAQEGVSQTQLSRWREKRFRAAAPRSKAMLKPSDSVNDDFALVSVDEERLFVDSTQAVQQLRSPTTEGKASALGTLNRSEVAVNALTPRRQSPRGTMSATQAPGTRSGVDDSSGHEATRGQRAAALTEKSRESMTPGIKRDNASFLWKLCDGYGPLLPDGWAMCSCNVPVKLEWGSCPRCGASAGPL